MVDDLTERVGGGRLDDPALGPPVELGEQGVPAEPPAAERQDRGPGDGSSAPDLTGMRGLSGEQSNTSVRIPGRAAEDESAAGDAVLKIFRVLAAGPNPDFEVAAALRDAGWPQVPDVLAGYRPPSQLVQDKAATPGSGR